MFSKHYKSCWFWVTNLHFYYLTIIFLSSKKKEWQKAFAITLTPETQTSANSHKSETLFTNPKHLSPPPGNWTWALSHHSSLLYPLGHWLLSCSRGEKSKFKPKTKALTYRKNRQPKTFTYRFCSWSKAFTHRNKLTCKGSRHTKTFTNTTNFRI